MPQCTAITPEGMVSDKTKAKIAEEITRIHTTVMKVPKSFVRIVFLSYPKELASPAGLGLLRPRSIAFCEAVTPPRRRRIYCNNSGRCIRSSPGLPRITSQFAFRRFHSPMPWRWGKLCRRSETNRLHLYCQITFLILFVELTYVLLFSRYNCANPAPLERDLRSGARSSRRRHAGGPARRPDFPSRANSRPVEGHGSGEVRY
jgi:phenylpyruvate tautomerase PptA (4-oxalocrotonate tautomerase family)